jgi:26S proteasome regulatory subunit N10
MTLEACVVVLDNTEYSRNGDYPPNRFEAQTETIPIIVSSKQQLN